MSDQGVKAVFAAISEVQDAIWQVGIAKDSVASGGGIKFNFRGIDAVQEAFAGPMSKAKLIMKPSYGEKTIMERKTNNGVTFNVGVQGSYTLVSLLDGSELFVGSFYGEANDTQDKATAKAQSIALRQAYLQTFNVPLGPGYDPEETDHDEGDGGGQVETHTQEKQPQPKPRVRANQPAAQGEIAGDASAGQLKIIDARLASKGLSRADLIEAGFATINTANFNDIQDWIKKQ